MIRTAAYYAALVGSTALFGCLAIVCTPLGAGTRGLDRINRGWARLILAAAGVRVTVRGVEHLRREGCQIIVANHQSYFDIWVLLASLPASVRFVAKLELARIPVLSAGMRSSGHVLIDRDRARSARKTLRAAGRRMRAEGLTLVLFPEGTRSLDGRVGPFRRGAFELALDTRAPLVPTAIEGSRRVCPPGARRVRPGRIAVQLAPPIQPEGSGPAGREALLRQTRDAVEAMLAEMSEVGRGEEG